MAVEPVPKPSTHITILRMEIADVPTVADLDVKCFPTPWTETAYYTEVNNPSAYYAVAKSDGRIVGYAGMWMIMDEAHITTIGVDPEFRGQKIGERVLVHILDEAVNRGMRRATLEVRRTNAVAQNLYAKYGFHTVAVRKGYYANNNEDAFVMWIDDMWSDEFLRTLRVRREALADSE